VPVDVAVEEPGPVVVGEEANRDIVPTYTNTHDIPDNRVVVVVDCTTGAADHMEVVPVQMKRVLLQKATTISLTILSAVADTHRTTKGATGNGYLNTLICFETIDAACGNEFRHIRTVQDLEQYWDGGGFIGNTINGEAQGSLVFDVRIHV
jgi:hypothetical protein